MKRHAVLMLLAVILTSLAVPVTELAADVDYDCLICSRIYLELPDGTVISYAHCWDPDTGIGHKYCYEFGNSICIRGNPCVYQG